MGYWGGGEQTRSGGVENMGDLAWGQGKSTGRWLRSIEPGENRAISSCIVGKPAPVSREEHRRFLSRFFFVCAFLLFYFGLFV